MLQINPQMDMSNSKHQTIEQYINENLQLKTLKIKKFSFQNSFSSEANPSKRLRNSLTTRQGFKDNEERYDFNSTNGWQPKLSYRKLMKEPKILLSVESRKIKTSESIRKANVVFSAPQSRLGFRGEKVRSHSFFIDRSQQKMPKKLVIQNNPLPTQRKQKQIPNFHFNFKYVIDQRKKSKNDLTVQQNTKQGSNKGYFVYFGSQNFTKYLQKNTYHPSHNNTNRLQHKQKSKREQIVSKKIE